MNIQQFAEQILKSANLADKLYFPKEGLNSFTDIKTSVSSIPDLPGRPPSLAMRSSDGKKTPFPTAADLKSQSARGIVLHFFANHELLAMELMALALLKFPEADAKFRLGIVHTIQEEQNHMRLYQKRMRDYGVDFGAVAVSSYFWDSISNMQSPMDYVIRMSMTFEQANLDFSLFYKELFNEIGDTETAEILDQVYREEIGHLKYGVTWFNRWRDVGLDEWQAYSKNLPFPMTPSRAKGIGFDRHGRKTAGLSDKFIDELYVYQCSKGRPPVVYFFNPASEMEALFPENSFTVPSAVNDVSQDLASLMMFVSQCDDVVISQQRPSTEFLTLYKNAGFALPQFADWTELSNRTITRFEPWGKTKYSQKLIDSFPGRIVETQSVVPPEHLFSKQWAIENFRDSGPESFPSTIVTDKQAVIDLAKKFLAEEECPLVIKAPHGSSGRNMIRVMRPGLEPKQITWIETTLKSQRSLICEPWVEKVTDLSVQIQVGATGTKILGITNFLTDKRGQYIGHFLGKKFHHIEQDFHREFHRQEFQRKLEEKANEVGEQLFVNGYRGPAGIDAFVFKSKDGLNLRRLVEINPRFTMGRIAFELEKMVPYKTKAIWLHLSKNTIKHFGWQNFSDCAGSLSSQFPKKFGKISPKDHRPQLSEGILFTNDPARAVSMVSILFVGDACDFAIKELASKLL
jgi:uncharacterized ferritin-like protein (DUF455 family)